MDDKRRAHFDCEDCWYSCATLTCDDSRKSDKCDCGADEFNEMAEAIAEYKEDAERYRWLRVHSTQPAESWSTHENPESLDEAIDAARKSESEHG